MDAVSELWSFVTTADSWWGVNGILSRTAAHVRLSALSACVAAALALPPAVYLGHLRRGGLVAVSVVNIGRAIPSFGILALALPFSIRWGFGLGFWPTFVALVLLGIPPIFTNAYVGVREVDRGVVESAYGMGMTGREVLFEVELPSSLPLLITGLRISTVQIIATATLGAFVGFQCLGSFIREGLASFDDGKLLAGAVLVALLAVLTELAFGVVQRALTPWARSRTRARPRRFARLAGVAPGR